MIMLRFNPTVVVSALLFVISFFLISVQVMAQDTNALMAKDSSEEVQQTIRQLYQKHLGRSPDSSGLREYTRRMLEEGKSASWLAEVLKNSPEGKNYRDANKVSIKDLVRPYEHLGLSLLLAIINGFIISQVYKYTHRGMNYELSFMSTLVLLAPIVAVVMLYIRGDLVLSLGLIGSLSIIRFRTPIKDSRDMIFLFWTIAVGLGAGTFNWGVVIISSLIMVPLVFLLYYFKYGRSTHADFILVCSGEGECPVKHMQQIINKQVQGAVVRSHEVNGGVWEMVYELRRTESGHHLTAILVQELRRLEGVHKVSLLAPKLDLPV